MIYQIKYNLKNRGFTLIEVLLVIIILTIITSISVSSYQNINLKNSQNIAVNTIVESIRYAKNKAQNQNMDSNWGVFLSNTNVIVFSGDNYSSRNSSNDIIFKLPNGILLSGLEEVVFNKLTGETVNTGDVTITNNSGFKTISINSYGVITYLDSGSTSNINTNISITNDWGSGYCADVTVSTDSNNPVVWNENILLDTPPKDGIPYEAWNAIWSFNNNTLTASGVSWNQTVVSGSPVVFGYCANRNVNPPPSSNVNTNISITNDWGSGYCADVTVSTDSTSLVTWNVDILLDTYPTNGTPSSVWNAIWSFNNNTLTAGGVSWNQTVVSGSPVVFGYCANR